MAYKLKEKYRRQVWVVKGGDGKSRIAAAEVFLLLQDPTVAKVHLVFSNQVLLDKDRTQLLQDLLAK